MTRKGCTFKMKTVSRNNYWDKLVNSDQIEETFHQLLTYLKVTLHKMIK